MKSTEFFLISYITELSDIQTILDNKARQITSYAYILHDKDTYTLKDCTDKDTGEVNTEKLNTLKKPHIHIYLKLNSSRDGDEIKRWFMVRDKDGVVQNCMREVVRSRIGAINYLTHNTVSSKAKHQYPKDSVISFNVDNIEENEPVDNTYHIVTDILNGIPKLELLRRYGRDYIYHYSCFKSFIDDVRIDVVLDEQKKREEEIKEQGLNPVYGEPLPFN